MIETMRAAPVAQGTWARGLQFSMRTWIQQKESRSQNRPFFFLWANRIND